jgi:regulator of sigma E protease
VPLLDGGHLLFYAVEMVKGSPVPEKVLVAGQKVGLTFLILLMGLAFYNDLSRYLG